jgi:hypothetical protein
MRYSRAVGITIQKPVLTIISTLYRKRNGKMEGKGKEKSPNTKLRKIK